MPSRRAFGYCAGFALAALAGAGLCALDSATGFIALGGFFLLTLAAYQLTPPARVPLALVPELDDGPGHSTDSITLPSDRLRLLESAVINAHDAVVILEAHPVEGAGRAVLYANDAFCRMTGYAREEVLGRSLHFLRGPGSDAKTLNAIRNALGREQPLRVELRNYRKDGTPFWVDLSLVPVRHPTGTAAHWVMIQRDITDRKAAEEALRRSEALFRGIFENTSAGVSLTDRHGKFVSCNPGFAAMLGCEVADVIGHSPEEFTHHDDWAAQVPLMEEVRAGTRDRFSSPKRYLRPNGEVVWAELSFVAVRGPRGELEYGLGVSMNVTERRRLEDQLRQAQKMEAVGQMAGGIAHDFNNILTAVLCNLGQIQLPETHPNRQHLTAVEQAAGRAADLTRKLLSYARRNQLVFSPVHPSEAFAEAVGLLRHTLDPRIRLSVRVEDGCELVQADSTLLSQVLLNLCLNSRDAMSAGGTITLCAASVDVTAADVDVVSGEGRPGRFIRLSVTDTGSGMTDEVQQHLFEPFFTTKGIGKGTGLGLAMVQGIVKQHRGWVTCASAPRAGTRFDLYFPPAAPETEPSRWTVPRSPAASDLTPTPLPARLLTPGERGTILLVDDEEMIRNIGRLVLEQNGFRVITASDGVEAVETFTREHAGINLVVLDVTMPRMSGCDAFRHLIAIDPRVRVLFSTGYASEDVSELEGAVGLLGKPYRPNELLTAVRAALQDQPAPA